MQTMNYSVVRDNVSAQCGQYSSGAVQGLPPLPRRRHRCPLGLRVSDLMSMSMAAMTIIATGMIVAGM